MQHSEINEVMQRSEISKRKQHSEISKIKQQDAVVSCITSECCRPAQLEKQVVSAQLTWTGSKFEPDCHVVSGTLPTDSYIARLLEWRGDRQHSEGKDARRQRAYTEARRQRT